MELVSKRDAILKYGYRIEETNSKCIVSDPLDNDEGFKVTCDSEQEAINEAYDHLILPIE